jgi:glycerol-3-phosphate acyltransferase PlsY
MIAASYVPGSVPMGLWFVRLATGKDVRHVGSTAVVNSYAKRST